MTSSVLRLGCDNRIDRPKPGQIQFFGHNDFAAGFVRRTGCGGFTLRKVSETLRMRRPGCIATRVESRMPDQFDVQLASTLPPFFVINFVDKPKGISQVVD